VSGGEEEGQIWAKIKADLILEHDDEREDKIAAFLNLIQTDETFDKFRDQLETDRSVTREGLIKFLRAGQWQLEQAAYVLRSYLAMGTLEECNAVVRESTNPGLEKIWVEKVCAVTEYRDKFGRRIFIYRPGIWDPSVFSPDQLLASSWQMFELMADEVRTQIAGITLVVDLAGFGFRHFRSITLEQIKCLTTFMSGSFPIWIRRIHIVNNPAIFSVLYNLAKPFLDDRVKNNMVFHGSNYEELHKAVPPFLLPQSCGGPEGEIEENEESVRLVLERSELFKRISKFSSLSTTL